MCKNNAETGFQTLYYGYNAVQKRHLLARDNNFRALELARHKVVGKKTIIITKFLYHVLTPGVFFMFD